MRNEKGEMRNEEGERRKEKVRASEQESSLLELLQ